VRRHAASFELSFTRPPPPLMVQAIVTAIWSFDAPLRTTFRYPAAAAATPLSLLAVWL
jgi:hypothetical protein